MAFIPNTRDNTKGATKMERSTITPVGPLPQPESRRARSVKIKVIHPAQGRTIDKTPNAMPDLLVYGEGAV